MADLPKRGFISGIVRDAKNILLGAAALPAHLITNPVDTIAKATVIGLSAIPVVGSVVAAAYTFKQSYRETGKLGMSFAKAAGAGILSTVPGFGPAITGMYAAKNIGEQVERDSIATGKEGIASSLASKYSKAKENLVELKQGGLKQNRQKFVDNIKKLGATQGWKDIASSAVKTFGPSSPEGVASAQAPNSASTIPFTIPVAIAIPVAAPATQVARPAAAQQRPYSKPPKPTTPHPGTSSSLHPTPTPKLGGEPPSRQKRSNSI